VPLCLWLDLHRRHLCHLSSWFLCFLFPVVQIRETDFLLFVVLQVAAFETLSSTLKVGGGSEAKLAAVLLRLRVVEALLSGKPNHHSEPASLEQMVSQDLLSSLADPGVPFETQLTVLFGVSSIFRSLELRLSLCHWVHCWAVPPRAPNRL